MKGLVFHDLEHLLILDRHLFYVIDPEVLTAPEVTCHLGFGLASNGNFHSSYLMILIELSDIGWEERERWKAETTR